MLKRILLAAALLINAAGIPAGGTDIGEMVAAFKSETSCRNVSVVVVDHGEMTFYGDKDGLYQIGSMTKSFTGLAIQKLIDKGVISETDKVSKLIPGFTAYYRGQSVDITVKDLLTQKSGFTNSETDYPSAKADMSLLDWAKTISGKELKCLPGTFYNYSNVNYNLLGLIIENITGKPYKDYMNEAVLEPMKLTSTSAGTPEKGRVIEGSRLGFRHAFEYKIPVRTGSIPAGYFYSNVEDTGKWIDAWIKGTDPSMENVLAHLEKEGDYYAGLERFEGDITGHSGGTPNYSSRMVFSKSKETGVCVLTDMNVAATTDSLCNNIFAELTGKSHGKLVCDVWTVFDIIFTSVTAIGAVLLVLVLISKKKGFLIGTGITLLVLLALILILFPVIFGAGLKEIAFTWAPWSFAGGLAVLAADIVAAAGRYIWVRKNARRAKTG